MEGFFIVLLRISLLGSLAAVLLMLLQPILHRLAGWTAVYYLWLVVLLRLCIPIGISVSLTGHADTVDRQNKTDAIDYVNGRQEVHRRSSSEFREIVSSVDTKNEETVVSEEPDKKTLAERILSIVSLNRLLDVMQRLEIPCLVLWALGVCIYLGWHIWAYMNFSRRVRRSLTEASPEAAAVLHELEAEGYMHRTVRNPFAADMIGSGLKAEESMHGSARKLLSADMIGSRQEAGGRIHLMESDAVHTPMLLGLLHPVIVLPAGMGEKSTKVLWDLLMHELVHARRQDLVYKWFVIVVSGLHWFNPLMYFIRHQIGRCCELSCDEAVIRKMNNDERRHYGETLLAVAAKPVSGVRTFTASFCEEKIQLKERLVSIRKYRKKGVCALLLSIIPMLAVAGCAMISSAGIGGADRDREVIFTESPDDSFSESENKNHSNTDTESEESQETGIKTAVEDYLAVLTGKNKVLYYAEGEDTAQGMDIEAIPAFFSPDSDYAEIDEFAVIDLDSDGDAEILLHILDAAGDLGGFMILKRQDGEVHGYSAHYKAISSLKTDGTFVFVSLARPDDGIGTIRFHETGYTVIPLVCSETEEDIRTTVYLKGGKQISEEEFLAEKEQNDAKPDAVWHRFTNENVLSVLSAYGEDLEQQTKNPAGSAGNMDSSDIDEDSLKHSVDTTFQRYDSVPEESLDDSELIYEKDGMLYELVEDLITGRHDWASVLSAGRQVKDSHGHKHTDYNSQERRFERIGDTQGAKESYPVRRFDNLLYSAGDYLIFEYDNMIHVSKSTDLYHPVLSYECGGTYGLVFKVPKGYMTADARAYEIRFYDEQFKETQVITGLCAGESGLYYQDGLMAVRDMETGLKGFMNQNGKLVIPCRYADASDFSNGFASVLTDAEVVPYTEDAGTVQLFYGKGGQWGIIDRKGQFVVEPSAEYANESPDDTDTMYVSGVRRFGPVRENGTVDFIAADQGERVLKTIKIW